MRVDADGNIYIVGAYYHQTRFSDEVVLDGNEDVKADCFVAKYSSAGEIVWIKSFSGRETITWRPLHWKGLGFM